MPAKVILFKPHPLKALVDRKEINQEDLAYFADIHASEVSRFLRGRLRASPERKILIEAKLRAAILKLTS